LGERGYPNSYLKGMLKALDTTYIVAELIRIKIKD
jgi:hypothetical protein